MTSDTHTESVNTLVIGGGQAGLSVGYHLQKRGVPFLILDAHDRIGDSWRHRWDSLRVFTPARFCALDGLPFPAPPRSFPTKDDMAAYLETYARTFNLPVRSGVRVTRLSRLGSRFVAVADGRRFEADHVVVAMGMYQQPRTPPFAGELDGRIRQLHSSAYRNPSQVQAGDVLLVGAGNSGAEIAMELSRTHKVWMAGPDVGHVPFRIESRIAYLVGVPLVLRVLYHRVLSVANPIGRRARPKMMHGAAPLVRTKPKDLAARGVERVPRVAGVRGGLPCLEDGRVLDVANVIWCTGYHPGFSWIDLPVFRPDGEPMHEQGVAAEPGLYFVGLPFLYALSSEMIHGVGRDAARIADHVAERVRENADAGGRRSHAA